MKKQAFFFTIIIITALLSSCKPNTAKEEAKAPATLSEALVGQWRNLTIEVEQLTVNGSDSTRLFRADSSNWESTLGIRPIRTYFNQDGSFRSEHYNLADSLVLNPTGAWKFVNDDLLEMITTAPFQDTTFCRTLIMGDTVRFDCMVDWDGDGQKDDRYIGVQKRFKE